MSSDRLLLEHSKSLSLSKAHRRLSSFVEQQLLAGPSLSASAISAVDDAASGAQLRAVDRVKVPDHIMYQLTRIRDSMDEERRREKGQAQTDGVRQAAEAENEVDGSSGRREGRSKQKKSKKRKSSAVTDD